MSEDLTDKLPRGNNEILTAIKNLDMNLRGSIDKLVSWVGSVDSSLQSLEKKVERIDRKVEEQLYDTRPIWHKVVAEIVQLQSGQQRLEEGMKELNSTVRTVSRDQIVINDAIRKIQLDYHAIDEHLHKIEGRNQQNSQT